MAIKQSDIKALPLFLGVTQTELVKICSSCHLVMRHHSRGTMIVREDDACDELLFLAKGTAHTDTCSDDHSYYMRETVQPPYMFEPDKLFGLSPHYTSSCRAVTSCITIGLKKDELASLMEHHLIVRLNYLNAICRKAQISERLLWQPIEADTRQRICRFIKQHCSYPAGHKQLYIKVEQFAKELKVSRREVSATLKTLCREEKIIWKRGIIDVPALQLL